MTPKLTLKAIASGLVSVLVVFSIGFSSPANAASCEATKPLARATVTTDSLEQGGLLTRYDFQAGQGNSSPYEARFTFTKSNLNYTTLTPTTAPYLRDRSQLSLAQGVSALVHVNGDFFDFSSRMLYSAIARGSQLNYSPQARSRVLGIRSVTASSKTGVLKSAIVKSGSTKFTIAGFNLPVLSGSKIIAYSSAFASSVLPAAAASILVVSGKVKTVYVRGTTIRPKSGYLFSAVGSAVTNLKKLKVGAAFSYKVPEGRIPALTRDLLTSSGTITNSSGTVLANISGVNFWASNYSSGAVVFDENYNATPPMGEATVVVAGNGVVTKVSTSGSSQLIPAGGKVVQFYGTAQNKISGFVVGSSVTIKRSFNTTSGNNYETVFGTGATLISRGVLVAPCTANSDTVRPRTAVGWDDYGNVYLATTTMGRDWYDGGQGGYRLGGSTLHQLGDWLRSVGATNAVALDGGGSTTMLAKLSGDYHRVDLPDGVWIRDIPQGVALIAR